jgi:DNA polymerase-3 subunit alpha
MKNGWKNLERLESICRICIQQIPLNLLWIAYQTAYLKANYPAEYMASVMSNNINNTASITMFMEDCKAIGVDVLGPDVNESQYKFSVNEKGQIRFGLGAIKGIGEGPSEDYQNPGKRKIQKHLRFFERVPSSQVNKRVAESLVIAGAFDELDSYHRGQYLIWIRRKN